MWTEVIIVDFSWRAVCLLPLTFFMVAAPLSRISLSPRGRYHLMYQVDCEQFKMVIHNVLKYGHDILPAALSGNVTRSVVSVCLPVSPSKTNWSLTLTFLHLLSHVHSTHCVRMRLVWYRSSIVGSLSSLHFKMTAASILGQRQARSTERLQTFQLNFLGIDDCINSWELLLPTLAVILKLR